MLLYHTVPHCMLTRLCPNYPDFVQIKYIGQAEAASDGSSLDMPPSSTMAAKGVQPHLENLKTKVDMDTGVLSTRDSDL